MSSFSPAPSKLLLDLNLNLILNSETMVHDDMYNKYRQTGMRGTFFFYCKWKYALANSKTSHVILYEENPKETKPILVHPPLELLDFPQIKATLRW